MQCVELKPSLLRLGLQQKRKRKKKKSFKALEEPLSDCVQFWRGVWWGLQHGKWPVGIFLGGENMLRQGLQIPYLPNFTDFKRGGGWGKGESEGWGGRVGGVGVWGRPILSRLNKMLGFSEAVIWDSHAMTVIRFRNAEIPRRGVWAQMCRSPLLCFQRFKGPRFPPRSLSPALSSAVAAVTAHSIELEDKIWWLLVADSCLPFRRHN